MSRSSRRMWLRGAGGVALAIPFLPSLFRAGDARAGATATKRFVALATEHGGVWQSYMYPGDASLTESMVYGGHAIRRGDLSLSRGAQNSLSTVLTAPSSLLTNALTSKLNLIRGLDVSFYIGHHWGGHLGNYAGNVENPSGVEAVPTIDQVMAWSPSFYPDLATILERSLVMGSGGMSANWSSPSTKSGTVQDLAAENDSLALFNRIFVPNEETEEPKRPPIVDRVLEDYKRLRDGSRRLSAADRQRLADHIDRVDELQRKINVQVSCGDIQPPTSSSVDEWNDSSFGIDPTAQKRFWQLMNDVIAAAFACDTCRIATMRVTDTFSSFPEDWHADVAHQAGGMQEAQDVLVAAHRQFFEDVFLDLDAKHDAIEEPAGTVLDNSLVQWTHESGVLTHDSVEMPVVTAGSAGGFLSTGNYVDYRDLAKQVHYPQDGNIVIGHSGLLYNQWLGTVLQAMGLPPAEYEFGGYGGYGPVVLPPDGWLSGQYGPELDVIGETMPFLKA